MVHVQILENKCNCLEGQAIYFVTFLHAQPILFLVEILVLIGIEHLENPSKLFQFTLNTQSICEELMYQTSCKLHIGTKSDKCKKAEESSSPMTHL